MLKDYNETYAYEMRGKTYLDACLAKGRGSLYRALRADGSPSSEPSTKS